MKDDHKGSLRRATHIRACSFSGLVLLVMLLPVCMVVVQAGFKVELPSWISSEEAQYLSGVTNQQDFGELFSLEGFQRKELQNGIDAALGDNVPMKAAVLLGNAALQRFAISTSNLLFDWDAYPTYYASDYIVSPSLGMTMVEALRRNAENEEAAHRFADVIEEVSKNNPDVRIVYQAIDETHSSPFNPSHQYVSDSYGPDWFKENVFSRFSGGVIESLLSVENERELVGNWFSGEHHWQVDGMLEAYDALANTLDLEFAFDREKRLVAGEWQGACARGGLMMDYPSEFYDLPTKFPHLTCWIDGKESSRGNRGDVLRGELPMTDLPLSAYYNLYHWYYGSTSAEILYRNSSTSNGKTLLFVEQSYGVPMEPYLASNYETTICVAPANGKVDKTLQQLIDEYDVDDIVVQMGPQPYSYIPNRSPALLEE